MSAFICSDRQFAVVARAVFPDSLIRQQLFANKLKRENIRSVNYRYKETTRFTKVNFDDANDAPAYTDWDIVGLLRCIDYQSCERPDYDDTLVALAQSLIAARNPAVDLKSTALTTWSI
jgi:hypothetical protein